MPSSAAIRLQIEMTLANRVPAALTLKIKQAPELFATGIAEVDAVLDGGIPRGGITEVAGAASTGKTSFGLSAIAAITQSGAACAWVDVSDTLSPESAAAANIVLKRLLWLRMSAERRQRVTDKPWSRLEQALKATDLLLQAGGFAAIVLDMSDVLTQHAMRIPLSTWYRYRLAAEQARTALLLLTQTQCANSCAALVLRCEPAHVRPFCCNGETALYEGQRYTLVPERNRNEGSPFQQKKPAAQAEWCAETLWSRVR
jgi:RecA/RadA recombinase